MFHLLKSRTSIDIFRTEKCKVTFGLKYITKDLREINLSCMIQLIILHKMKIHIHGLSPGLAKTKSVIIFFLP